MDDIDFSFDTLNLDLYENMQIVSNRDNLVRALIRRLLTPKGRLIDDEDYGFDLVGYINDDITQRDIAHINAFVSAEMLKDERIIFANTTSSFANGVLSVLIRLVDKTAPFSLTLAVTDVSLSLLKVGS